MIRITFLLLIVLVFCAVGCEAMPTPSPTPTITLTPPVVPTPPDIPPTPHAFYGRVMIHGLPAPVGTTILARGFDVRENVPGNPLVTIADGKYGGPWGLEPKLVVQGYIADGTLIEFYVNGEKANCKTPSTLAWGDDYPFQAGDVTQLDLNIP